MNNNTNTVNPYGKARLGKKALAASLDPGTHWIETLDFPDLIMPGLGIAVRFWWGGPEEGVTAHVSFLLDKGYTACLMGTEEVALVADGKPEFDAARATAEGLL